MYYIYVVNVSQSVNLMTEGRQDSRVIKLFLHFAGDFKAMAYIPLVCSLV